VEKSYQSDADKMVVVSAPKMRRDLEVKRKAK